MKPGVSTRPRASTTESLELGVSCPICWILPPAILTSAVRLGPPVPSTTMAPRIRTRRAETEGGVCAEAGAATQKMKATKLWTDIVHHVSSKTPTLGDMTTPVPARTEPGLRRVIGVRGLAAAIFNITVGAAIFVLPAHVAGGLGAA